MAKALTFFCAGVIQGLLFLLVFVFYYTLIILQLVGYTSVKWHYKVVNLIACHCFPMRVVSDKLGCIFNAKPQRLPKAQKGVCAL